MKISELIKNFVADQDVNDNSRELYRRVIRLWFRYLQSNNISHQSVRREHVLNYKRYLTEQGKSNLTVNSYISIVGLFYKWAAENECYPTRDVSRLTEGIKRLKYPYFRKGPLTREQVAALLEAPDDKTIKGKRDRAILALLAKRGLRTIEVSRANVGDLTESGMYIQRKGHTEKDDFVPLTDETFQVLNDYLVTRDNLRDDQPLFTSLSRYNRNKRIGQSTISKIVRRYLNQIGIRDKRITAHSLRHSIAIHLLESGISEYEVQLFLGHSSIKTTQIYTRYAEAEMKKRNRAGTLIDELFNLSSNKRLNSLNV